MFLEKQTNANHKYSFLKNVSAIEMELNHVTTKQVNVHANPVLRVLYVIDVNQITSILVTLTGVKCATVGKFVKSKMIFSILKLK